MERQSDWLPKILALGYMLAVFGLVFLYVREFPFLGNTLNVKGLVLLSIGTTAAISAVGFWFLRKHLLPISKHIPEVVSVVFPLLFFAPLAGSRFNRLSETIENQEFKFVSEVPYLASPGGILEGEKIEPTGFRLTVRLDDGSLKIFKYKQQAYYPLTKPGELILLPMRQGLLGFSVLDLK